jgi:hypothetical protein
VDYLFHQMLICEPELNMSVGPYYTSISHAPTNAYTIALGGLTLPSSVGMPLASLNVSQAQEPPMGIMATSSQSLGNLPPSAVMPSTPQSGGVASAPHYWGLGLPASYDGSSPLAPYNAGLSTAPNSMGVVSASQSVPYTAYIPNSWSQTNLHSQHQLPGSLSVGQYPTPNQQTASSYGGIYQSQALGGFLPSSAIGANIHADTPQPQSYAPQPETPPQPYAPQSATPQPYTPQPATPHFTPYSQVYTQMPYQQLTHMQVQPTHPQLLHIHDAQQQILQVQVTPQVQATQQLQAVPQVQDVPHMQTYCTRSTCCTITTTATTTSSTSTSESISKSTLESTSTSTIIDTTTGQCFI